MNFTVSPLPHTPHMYSDFVTILRLASLQYITKLAMSQSQKPWSPLPQNIK